MQKIQVETESAKSLLNTFIHKAYDKLSIYETRTITRVATILDPRFKKAGFVKASNIEEAVKATKFYLSEIIKLPDILPPAEPTTTASNEKDEDNLFSFLDTVKNEVPRTPTVDAISLLDSFFLLPNIDKNSTTDQCLNNLKKKHPELYNVFLGFANIPGSSVPCERLFSNAGYTVTDRRNRLSAHTLNMIIFLNKNCDLV